MDIEKVDFMIIFEMPIDDIRTAPFNPPARVEPYALKELLNQIRQYGILEPVKLSRDGILADGHRRVACAKIIGLKTVPARRYDLSLEELWSLNFGQLPVNPKDTLSAVCDGLPIEMVPRFRRGPIEKLKALIGDDGIKQLAGRRISSHVLQIAKRVANYCQIDDPEFTKVALWWLINNNQQFMARKAMDGGITPEVLEEAVMHNRKLVQNWTMTR